MGATKLINDKTVTRHQAVVKSLHSRKKRKKNVPFLSDGMVFQILVRLPADILFNVMRYVCKQWYNIINSPLFVREHVVFSRSFNSGGICFHCYEERAVYLAHFGQKKATVSKLITLPSTITQVFSVCDGLILFYCKKPSKAYVANPVTKQLLTLPPISPVPEDVFYWLRRVGSAVEFKVVFTSFCKGMKMTCGVMTLGKDETWRYLDTPPFPACPSIVSYEAAENGKFIHLTDPHNSGMVTFDFESELFSITSVPDPYFIVQNTSIIYIERSGCMIYMVGFHRNTLWEVWTWPHKLDGRWKKLFDIDFRSDKHQLGDLGYLFRGGLVCPVVWISDELVVFRNRRMPPFSFISYNIKTDHTYELVSGYKHKEFFGVYSCYASTLVSDWTNSFYGFNWFLVYELLSRVGETATYMLVALA